MAADQAPADDGLWHGHAEVLREFHSTRQALHGKDLHHTNRITQLPTEALPSKIALEKDVIQQIKNDVRRFFETAHNISLISSGLTQDQNMRGHHADPFFTDAAIVQ